MSELQTQNITEADVVLGKIANGLQSAASDHILGIAKDIYDTKQQAYQEDINEYLLNKVDEYFGDNTEDEEESFLDAVLERDVLTEVTIGGIELGTTLEEGMTFTEFVERLFTLINYGSIGSISSYGNVSIAAPIIKVEKYENGSWISIDTGTTVKENTRVRVLVTDIPKSVFEDVWAGIKKGGTNPGNVLAYGWLKSVNDCEAEYGTGDCEITTKTKITGEDYLTIPTSSNTGIFASLKKNDDGKIDLEFTVPASTYNSTTEIGKITVKSNSATYQLQSDNKHEIAAVSSKHASKPEQLDKIPDKRKLIIEKDTNIGASKNNSNTQSFILKVEGWGIIPSLTTTGTLNINPPTIKVINNTEGGKEVNSGDSLDPNHNITVQVKLNDNSSSVSGASAYLQKTSSTFQYGWEKLKNGLSDELVTSPTSSQKCTIGAYSRKKDNTEDILEISGTPTNAFKNIEISSDKKTITFNTQVGEVASGFKVKAKSAEHELLSDAKYDIYALSSIHSSGKSTQMNNTYSIANGDVLKTFGSIYSSESTFSFNIKNNPFGIIPAIIINGVVSIGKPTITVTRISNGDVFGDGDTPELDPREKINVNVTIPKSQVTTNFSAIYKYSSNGLQYGWKLYKDDVETTGGTGTNCEIGLYVDHGNDTLNIKSATGVFKDRNFSGNVINWSNITASEASTLEVEAIAGTRTIYPDANYVLYALSELGHTKDSSTTKTELNKNTSLKTISGIKSSSIFNFKLLEELWGIIPTLTINNCTVSIAKPTITVKKSGQTTALSSPVELNSSDTLDIEITLNESAITTPNAYYQPNESSNYLTYGWKLYKSGTQVSSGDKKTNCNIELTTKKDSTDTHTFNTKTGVFSGLSTSTLKLSNVSVGSTGGTLKITSTPSKYTVSPKYDYTIYALSRFENHNDEHSAKPGSKQYSGSAQSATFTYTVKAVTYSSFYAWDVKDFMPIFNSLNGLNGNASDEDIISAGLTKYTGIVSGGKLNNGYVVVFAKTAPKLYNETGAPVSSSDWLEIDNNYPGSRKLYVFPSGDPSNVVWKNLTINE